MLAAPAAAMGRAAAQAGRGAAPGDDKGGPGPAWGPGPPEGRGRFSRVVSVHYCWAALSFGVASISAWPTSTVPPLSSGVTSASFLWLVTRTGVIGE